MTERDITRFAAVRTIAFLREQVRLVPTWHPLHREYSSRLAELEGRITVAPVPEHPVETAPPAGRLHAVPLRSARPYANAPGGTPFLGDRRPSSQIERSSS